MPNKKKRQPRRYLQLSDAAVNAMLSAIDSFNRVHGEYKTETTLILLSNSWELLAKAVLVKRKKNIYTDSKKTKSISCEDALNKLVHWKELETNQAELLQQIISLRNRCTHDILPPIPPEIQHHLLFFSCKFFKELSLKQFPKTEDKLTHNFLTLSFDHMTTYSDTVQRLVSKLRRGSKNDKELVWLLERGIRYVEVSKYISQPEFEALYKGKKKITPYLKIGEHMEHVDMVRIVPVQAPKNYTADISLRKGSKKAGSSLPVAITKSDLDETHPLLTKDVAAEIGRTPNFTAKALKVLGIKGNDDLHRALRTSSSGEVQRYSVAAMEQLKEHLAKNPEYNPYATTKA